MDARSAVPPLGIALFSMLHAAGMAAVTVPAGTPIAVHVVDEISSHRAHKGDRFSIRVASDVVVRGAVVVRSSAPGEGEIAAVAQAGKHGRSGALEICFDWVQATDGQRIVLSPQPFKASARDRKLLNGVASVAGFAALGIGGFFTGNLVHGKDVAIGPAEPLVAAVGQDVLIATGKHVAVRRPAPR